MLKHLKAVAFGMALTFATSAQSNQVVSHTTLPLIDVKINGVMLKAVAIEDRVRLSKDAASAANLKRAGLDWKDLYAIVNAESDWSPRSAIGRNGKASMGLAQLEAATAKSLNVDPHNTKQALGAVASLLKEATAWSRAKGHSKDSGGISVYYNLSTAARNRWNGDVLSLPIETQRHISNFKQSRFSAAMIERKILNHERLLKSRMAQYKPRRIHVI